MSTRVKIALGIVVAAFVALVAARALMVPGESQEPAEDAPGAEQVAQDPPDEGPALTDRQRRLIAGYDQATLDLIATLEASTWTTGNEASTLSFEDGTYTERNASGDVERTVAYAIEAVKTTVANDSGATINRQTIVLDDGEGTEVISYDAVTSPTGDVSYTVSSDDFELSSAYLRAEPSEGVAVLGLDEAMAELIGGKTDELAEEMASYCALNYPTATSATFNNTATIDWDARTVSFSLMLDTRSRIDVPVTYSQDTSEFTIGRSK